MKNKVAFLAIALLVMLMITVVSLLYAYNRHELAKIEHKNAEMNYDLARRHREAAEAAEAEATRQAAEAIRQKRKAEEALADCKGK